ncbi:hypothetical protein PHLGIDRAFT_266337 [Phlebiopsis gigantea 11061_1 CR5-6]|uniref:Uncharacterized protein n=1 Tax=Phlebiopsis gigantea (strain 11061_1 CR5-6) TaxID=745531 RepID=A0A0C3S3R4_PHLG1|nr:hypothetical protein PHLGIDRAFT_266337 [Phlebiopsis gigantea 11061_1 CR5-6]
MMKGRSLECSAYSHRFSSSSPPKYRNTLTHISLLPPSCSCTSGSQGYKHRSIRTR